MRTQTTDIMCTGTYKFQFDSTKYKVVLVIIYGQTSSNLCTLHDYAIASRKSINYLLQQASTALFNLKNFNLSPLWRRHLNKLSITHVSNTLFILISSVRGEGNFGTRTVRDPPVQK